MLDTHALSAAYRRYGFEEAKSGYDNILVFTLKAGHYHNADIVPTTNIDIELLDRIFNQFKESGYACRIRNYNDISQVTKTLFQGFFSVDTTHKRLMREYSKFTSSIIRAHSDNAEYKYINSSYFVNDSEGESTVIHEIISRINDENPILFLIEAAAGFGKTCTAYELLKVITENHKAKVPLFTELSRNRQAKIFRYVLLDEIDRSFPLLSSSLVRTEIRNGNVPVILDGFDELLHQADDSVMFDNTEPMLETIGELLTERAKVILTTRRTSILDGDDFHEWMERHESEFQVIRIRIETPTVENWLEENRLDILRDKKFPIENLCNPVLLSYLRSIPDDEFIVATSSPDELVERYFSSMLERERKRQDLLMSPKEQYNTLKYIAADMMNYDYTAESKDYIASILQDYFKNGELEQIRKLYPADSRPTSDEIINKLISHALLDRSVDTSSQIGFVNDFVLGNFCSEIIIDTPDNEWCGNKIFIEPAALSFIPRTVEKRKTLWKSLIFSLEFCAPRDKITTSIILNSEVLMDIDSETIENIKIKDVAICNRSNITNSVFTDCSFQNITFYLDNMRNVSFVNCNFFNCTVEQTIEKNGFYAFGCSDNNGFLSLISNDTEQSAEEESNNEYNQCDAYILSKFWPIGNQTIYKHRPMKGLYIKNNNFSYEETIMSIAKLRKNKIIVDADKNGIAAFNMEKLPEVRALLGR